jgi:hypothetical protein
VVEKAVCYQVLKAQLIILFSASPAMNTSGSRMSWIIVQNIYSTVNIYFFIGMLSWKDVIACWYQDHGGIQLKSGSNGAAAVQQECDKKGTQGTSAPVRRLRLRGDWSDTGPDARPEREGGRRGGMNYYIFKNNFYCVVPVVYHMKGI